MAAGAWPTIKIMETTSTPLGSLLKSFNQSSPHAPPPSVPVRPTLPHEAASPAAGFMRRKSGRETTQVESPPDPFDSDESDDAARPAAKPAAE